MNNNNNKEKSYKTQTLNVPDDALTNSVGYKEKENGDCFSRFISQLSLSHFHIIHDGKQLPLLLVYICDSHPKLLNYFQKGKQAYACYHVL